MKGMTTAASILIFAGTCLGQSQNDDHRWWVSVEGKSGCVAVNPKDAATIAVACESGKVSPDGAMIAYLSAEPGSAMMDLFVAENPKTRQLRMYIAVGEPKARQVTRGVPGIAQFSWLPDGKSIVFQSTESGQIYLVRTDGKDGAMIKPRQISDGSGRCFQPTVCADGRIAWLVARSRQGKETLSDLVITRGGGEENSPAAATPARQVVEGLPQAAPGEPRVPLPPMPKADLAKIDAEVAPLATDTLVKSTGVYSMSFSADGTKLAYGVIGELRIHDFADGSTRRIKLMDVCDQLFAHYPADVSWRPDGKLIAASFHFAGGRAAAVDPANPGVPGPMPVLFGDREIFFIPVDPSAKCWWVSGPAGTTNLGWVNAETAQPRAK